MNREIKFRGKSNHPESFSYGDFVFGSLITRGELAPLINVYDENGSRDVSVDPETVGQFTDIKDGKRTEIYKDDIIEVTLRHNKETVSTYIAVVDQKEGAFGFKNKQGFCPFYGQIHENYRVIGNIHDNPELMEGGEK